MRYSTCDTVYWVICTVTQVFNCISCRVGIVSRQIVEWMCHGGYGGGLSWQPTKQARLLLCQLVLLIWKHIRTKTNIGGKLWLSLFRDIVKCVPTDVPDVDDTNVYHGIGFNQTLYTHQKWKAYKQLSMSVVTQQPDCKHQCSVTKLW